MFNVLDLVPLTYMAGDIFFYNTMRENLGKEKYINVMQIICIIICLIYYFMPWKKWFSVGITEVDISYSEAKKNNKHQKDYKDVNPLTKSKQLEKR